MARDYRPVLRDQVFLLPPDMRDWLPEDHLVWFVLDVIETLDVAAFEMARRRGGVGAAGYDPRMLLGLLVYSYCRGVRSSRQIERQCHTDIAFKVLCAGDIPDHATIARFRAVSEKAFVGLFAQVLMIAARAGIARFGTIAIDGTKIPANASIDANRGRDWFDQHAARTAAGIVADAVEVDAAEDREASRAGAEPDGDRVPRTLTDRSDRVGRIRRAAAELDERHRGQDTENDARDTAARTRLETSRAGRPVRGRIPEGPLRLAEARAHLDRELRDHQAKLDRRAAILAAGKKPMGSPPVATEEHSRIIRARRVVAAAEAAAAAGAVRDMKRPVKNLPKTVANITDPDSRVMPTRRGFVQGYNAQVAVTSDHVIAVVDVTRSPNDMGSFVPMMTAAVLAASALHQVTGAPDHLIGVVLADAGYCSNNNLDSPGPDRLIALGKSREQAAAATRSPTAGPPPTGATTREAMAHRLRTPEGSAAYKRRGATVEPSIGTLKTILGRFSRRGLPAALSELNLAAAAYNIRKIHTATT
jgi:transposase